MSDDGGSFGSLDTKNLAYMNNFTIINMYVAP